MKILLIGANSLRIDGRPWHETGRKHAYAPTTLSLLAALVPAELGAEVTAVDEAVEEVPDDFGGADIVGISAMTCDVERAYELGDRARAMGITVVMGGYHVSFLPEEALAHADAVVIGFAEEAWPRLLRDFAAGRLQQQYRGAWEQRFAGDACVPRREVLNRWRYLIPATLETSRGCTNSCRFCVIPPMHDGLFVPRAIAAAAADLESVAGRRVALLDSNPFVDPAHTGRLFEVLKRRGMDWYAATSLGCIRDEAWVRSAADSGCRGLLIGFESLSREALRCDGKAFNKVGEYGRVVRMLHDHGIAVLGCFVFGFDADGPSVFEQTVAFVDRSGIDLVLYSVYTPFPGSPLERRLASEGRLLTRPWRMYDGRHAVFAPARMSAERLEAGLCEAWTQTYRLSSILRRVVAPSPSPFVSLAGNLAFRFYSRTFAPSPTGGPRAQEAGRRTTAACPCPPQTPPS